MKILWPKLLTKFFLLQLFYFQVRWNELIEIFKSVVGDFLRPYIYRPKMGIVKIRKFGVRSKIFLLSKSVQDYGNRSADFYLVMQAVGWARYSHCMWTLQSLLVNLGYFLIVFPFRSALETSATAPPPHSPFVCRPNIFERKWKTFSLFLFELCLFREKAMTHFMGWGNSGWLVSLRDQLR